MRVRGAIHCVRGLASVVHAKIVRTLCVVLGERERIGDVAPGAGRGPSIIYQQWRHSRRWLVHHTPSPSPSPSNSSFDPDQNAHIDILYASPSAQDPLGPLPILLHLIYLVPHRHGEQQSVGRRTYHTRGLSSSQTLYCLRYQRMSTKEG